MMRHSSLPALALAVLATAVTSRAHAAGVEDAVGGTIALGRAALNGLNHQLTQPPSPVVLIAFRPGQDVIQHQRSREAAQRVPAPHHRNVRQVRNNSHMSISYGGVE